MDVHLVGPSYRIHQYTDQIYKIIHYPNPRLEVLSDPDLDRSRKGNSQKLDSAISRAKKVVLELALCNNWDWFCTFTLDKTKYDRFNLQAWYSDFSQWLRDQRKKYHSTFAYVLVPEQHSDGAWHIHGLLSGIPAPVSFLDLRSEGWNVPDKLVDNDYFCWLDYHNKFGFCSLGRVRDPVAVSFYVIKYISKSLSDSSLSVGSHLYYSSHGLNRSFLKSKIYGEDQYLNGFLCNKYEFCETGFTQVSDGLDWSFGIPLTDVDWFSSEYPDEAASIDQFFQLSFSDLEV